MPCILVRSMFGKTCVSIRYGCCHAGECGVIGTMKQVVPETQIRPLAATAGGGRKLLVRPTLLLTVIGGPLCCPHQTRVSSAVTSNKGTTRCAPLFFLLEVFSIHCHTLPIDVYPWRFRVSGQFNRPEYSFN